jgi:hypothetical protein
MLSSVGHKGNANLNQHEIPFQTHCKGYDKKDRQVEDVGMHVKLEP